MTEVGRTSRASRRTGADDTPRLVGIVPAAGHATRLQPLLGSKETCRVAGKPLMDHLIDRLRRAACKDIRVVTRPEKTDVITHAERLRLTVVRANPPTVSGSLLEGLEGTDPDDVVLLGFPDTIWEPFDRFVRLLDALGGFQAALGLFRGREPERSDVVEFAESGIVTSVAVAAPGITQAKKSGPPEIPSCSRSGSVACSWMLAYSSSESKANATDSATQWRM
jgi:hypothetical protein